MIGADTAGSDTWAGQAIYTPLTFRLYDLWVQGVSNRWLWQCPTAIQLEHYRCHVGAVHLEIGVGTGWYPARAGLPEGCEVTLLDLNQHALNYAARRLRAYDPNTVRADAFAPLSLQRTYESVAINYLLHCLPGSMEEKSAVLDNLVPCLAPDGVVFGATILGDRPLNRAGRKLMDLYNRKGVFDNRRDTEAALRAALAARFVEHEVTVEGAVALFSARRPLDPDAGTR